MISDLCGISNSEVYLDDTVAYSATRTEHMRHLKRPFTNGFVNTLAKFEFVMVVAAYLGKQEGQVRSGQCRNLPNWYLC